MKKNFEKTDENVVDIYDISYEGAGVGRIGGKIVFVPKTLKNEQVKVSILKNTSSFLIGKVTEILQASGERKTPKCPYFDECGGCDFQHCEYKTEKQMKIDILKNQLRKVGFEGEVGFVESDKRFGYRNKIKLEIRDGKVGYFKAKSREFLAVESCVIATPLINDCIKIIQKFLQSGRLVGAKAVYVKQVEEAVAVCFLFDKTREKVLKNMPNFDVFGEFLVYFAFGEVLESNSTKIVKVYGDSKLTLDLGGKEVEIEVSAFNQINDFIAGKLYDYVTDFCKGKRVVNGYSGQGFLTYKIAQNAKFVYGIEYQNSAHKSAEMLANSFKDYKIQNFCGRVEDCLPEILTKDRIDVLVLDPPREGCARQVLDAVTLGKIEQVIYTSCNFSTLVRDLQSLKNSYKIESVKIFDMFPCCCVMETVVVLKK